MSTFEVNHLLVINSVNYYIAEHPLAPGIPYGQEGRAAVVYQLLSPTGETRALKVFKPRFRLPALTGQAHKIGHGSLANQMHLDNLG